MQPEHIARVFLMITETGDGRFPFGAMIIAAVSEVEP